MKHRHRKHIWTANTLGLGCTVAVREAGPVTNPLCNIRGIMACASGCLTLLGVPLKCCEVRCRFHAPRTPRKARPRNKLRQDGR